jgi:cytochrome c556
MKIGLSVIVASLLLFALRTVSSSWAQPKVNDVHNFMRAKLDDAKKVLEGLTVEDFDLIVKNAQEMSLLSEDSVWQVLQTPEYSERSAEFRRTANHLRDAGKEKNLDAASLAYLKLTMQCIDCHKYVRDVRSGGLKQPQKR